jgi:hypothetical protein
MSLILILLLKQLSKWRMNGEFSKGVKFLIVYEILGIRNHLINLQLIYTYNCS